MLHPFTSRSIAFAIALLCMCTPSFAIEKTRIIVLTDIENEPDDAQSMVRFLTYANDFDVEGLVATTSIHQQKRTAAARIQRIVEAYGKVQANLSLHEPSYPTADQLVSVIREGRADYGMNAVGEGQNSSGSELLIEAADRDDPRPLWVTVWGGPNVLAQALRKVKATRSPETLATFVAKLRVYTISDQDNSGPWIRKTFPDLFYIASPGLHDDGAYHYATWSGISGDKFHARFTGADFSIVDNAWLDEHIRQNHGPLGAEHPHTEYLMEGDTPSFLGLVNNGLNTPEHPNWGGWGGRYEFNAPRMQKWFREPETRPFWTNAVDEVKGFDGNWHTTNHTTDPDGDELSYEWFYYSEVGSFTASNARSGDPVTIENADKQQAAFKVPNGRVMLPGTGTMHIILAVTDKITPPLTRYGRVIVDVTE